MNLGVVVERARAREADRPRRLAGYPQLAPGLAAYADERLDLGELGTADRRGGLVGASRIMGLLHFRSPLVELVNGCY